MDVIDACCCGLDLHKRRIVACAIVTDAAGQVRRERRTFGTMTDDLLALADWLASLGVTHVAMESTGTLWKPVCNLLEGQFTLALANAQHLKTVPGRKTDVRDAEWIAECFRHGLLRPSFVPDRAQRELRELTRYRTSLIQERAAQVNRVQKTLEGANIQVASVASDVLGASGRPMRDALSAGHTDAAALADLAKGRLREKRGEVQRALTGQVGAHQRFLLAQQLAHIDFLTAAIDEVSAEIGERLRPFQAAIARLDTIPAVGERTAQVLLAEVGADVARFPSAAHLASWAGLCPGNNESGGKRRSGRTRTGRPWLRAALVEAAQAAARSKATDRAALSQRIRARRGAKKAAVAVGHALLVIASHLLSRQESYHDLGPTFFDERHRQAATRRAVQRLQQLGYRVTLDPAA
jgi:transposase